MQLYGANSLAVKISAGIAPEMNYKDPFVTYYEVHKSETNSEEIHVITIPKQGYHDPTKRTGSPKVKTILILQW